MRKWEILAFFKMTNMNFSKPVLKLCNMIATSTVATFMARRALGAGCPLIYSHDSY